MNRGEEGGMEVKKHIVRYYHSRQRNNVKSFSTCLSADYDIYPCCYDYSAGQTSLSEHQSSDWPISAAVLKWSCHSWRSSFSVCHSVPRDWCSSFFLLPFAAAPAVGLADLKCWWTSDSDWARRYIFIILQSAPKTLSLVFKVLDGKLQSRAGLQS